MDPLDMSMNYMQQMASLAEKQAVLGKRSSALELTRTEGEIAVAAARAAVADAEVAKVRAQLASVSDDDVSAGHLNALLAAATAERDARLQEVEALEGYLVTKREMAELALDVDPNVMNQVVTMMNGIIGDDPDHSGR